MNDSHAITGIAQKALVQMIGTGVRANYSFSASQSYIVVTPMLR